MKLCRDCIHSTQEGEYSKCKALMQDSSQNPVTGKVKNPELHYCSVARQFNSLCGNGTLWKPLKGSTTPSFNDPMDTPTPSLPNPDPLLKRLVKTLLG